MSNLLRKSNSNILLKEDDRYSVYNFCRNPFPNTPGVIMKSPDSRVNGSIYFPEIRKFEEKKFEELLIPQKSQKETKNIAFLMDYATRKGRGIGKTAFLNFQKNRILKDFGDHLTDGEFVIFATHIIPLTEENYKNFWKITKLIIKALNDDRIIANAMCRIRAFAGNIKPEILDNIGNDLLLTLGDDKWLDERQVSIFQLEQDVKHALSNLEIDNILLDHLLIFGHKPFEFEHKFLEQSDSYWRNNKNTILFDDLIKVFQLAGFSKGILLFDEVEKIFTKLNSVERRSFVENLRYFFVDGQNENARVSFFNILLTIHPYLQELMVPHWDAAGLDRFAALGGEFSKDSTIYFNPIHEDMAIPLAKVYIDNSRINQEEIKNYLFPFTENALNESLKIVGSIPGKYLRFLNTLVDRGIEKEWRSIDIKEVREVAAEETPKEPESDTQIDPLPKPKINLK